MVKVKGGILLFVGLALAALAICCIISNPQTGSAIEQIGSDIAESFQVVSRYDSSGADLRDNVEQLDVDIKDKVIKFS